MKLAHQTEIKNMKNAVMEESVDFVKRSAAKVTRLMTFEHRKMMRQFIGFKEAAYEKMDTMENYYRDCILAEIALA